ncbi:porin [Paraburkholderia bannensis]|uniref:porin n=1 Tax=Paraburkholderia bannensis TaxID=765414 RepID=UPI002ABE4C43|nr:porin [Paraburkholderia bannensis]
MKKLILASAVLAVFSSHSYAQSSVTLYGTIDTALIYANNMATGTAGRGTSGVEMDSGGTHASRWGLQGKENLGGGVFAIFQLEDGFSSTNGKLGNTGDIFGRQAYVGLSSATDGKLTVGRQYSFMSQWLSALSAEGRGWGGNLASHPFNNDDMIRHTSIRNSVRYVTPTWRGLTLGAMYGFSNESGEFANNRAYSLGARYENGPLAVVASYGETDRSAGTANFNADGAISNSDGDATITGGRERVWGLGTHYTFGHTAVGVVWTHSSTRDVSSVWQGGNLVPLVGDLLSFDNFEINGRYFVTPALSLAASYTYTDGHFEASDSSLNPKWHEAILQADYRFSHHTDVYLESLYQTVSGGGGNTVFNASMFNVTPSANGHQLLLVAGLRHNF